MFKFETHLHTSETSPCSNISGKDAIIALKEKGYHGTVITDHYYKEWFDLRADYSFSEKIDSWLTGYKNAVDEGEKLGITVFLGMEIKFEGSHNDYLVFGVTEEILKNNPQLYLLGEEKFKSFAEQNNLLFVQAHPFRAYITAANPKNIHGVEVFNGNLRHDSHNDLAEAFAQEYGLIMLSGSDFHEYEDLNNGGIFLKSLPQTNDEFVKMLRTDEVILYKGLICNE